MFNSNAYLVPPNIPNDHCCDPEPGLGGGGSCDFDAVPGKGGLAFASSTGLDGASLTSLADGFPGFSPFSFSLKYFSNPRGAFSQNALHSCHRLSKMGAPRLLARADKLLLN